MLTGFLRPWAGKLVPLLDQPLEWRTFSYHPTWTSDTALSHHLMSYHQTQKRNHHLRLHCLLWGISRQSWGHPSVSFSLRLISLVSSAAPHMSCPLVLSPALLASFEHIPIYFYPSCLAEPKTAHSAWRKATPTLSKFSFLMFEIIQFFLKALILSVIALLKSILAFSCGFSYLT